MTQEHEAVVNEPLVTKEVTLERIPLDRWVEGPVPATRRPRTNFAVGWPTTCCHASGVFEGRFVSSGQSGDRGLGVADEPPRNRFAATGRHATPYLPTVALLAL